jgi:hypothetical protein
VPGAAALSRGGGNGDDRASATAAAGSDTGAFGKFSAALPVLNCAVPKRALGGRAGSASASAASGASTGALVPCAGSTAGS